MMETDRKIQIWGLDPGADPDDNDNNDDDPKGPKPAGKAKQSKPGSQGQKMRNLEVGMPRLTESMWLNMVICPEVPANMDTM